MKNHNTSKLLVVFLCFFTINLIGCATAPNQIRFRSSEVLLKENPIKKIAILGEAKIMRPRMGGKSAILSLSESKLFLEDSMPKLKKAFIEKGYDVVSSEPVAVGYYWRGPDDYWIYDYESKGDEPSKWQANNSDPVFEYPFVKQDETIRMSVRQEYENIYEAASVRRLGVYDPLRNNLKTISEATNADTVCFARLWGKRYSAGRMAGDMALSVLSAMFGVVRSSNLIEAKRVNIVCAESTTAKVLFQDTLYLAEDPLNNISIKKVSGDVSDSEEDDASGDGSNSDYKDSFFIKALAKMPNANESLPGNCRMVDRVRMIISCDTNSKMAEEDSSF